MSIASSTGKAGLASMTVARRVVRPLALLTVAQTVLAGPAFAHSANGMTIDFWGGFTHPLFGPDHVIAMVAVGLWGSSARPRSGSCRWCFRW
jgi:hydrogenase/urease accessory protein HupE